MGNLDGNRGYHFRELEVALSKDDPRRLAPKVPDGARRVLDIGCGAGQTLIALGGSGWRGYGVDIDQDALRLGREWLEGPYPAPVELLAGAGERLPFGDRSFDLVMCRVALPYMHIPETLREVARVAAGGARVWFALHAPSMFRLEYARSLRGAAYSSYMLANSLLFHFTGRQFRYPLNRRRVESYQTEGGMRRGLERSGFENVQFERTPTQFVVTAVRRRG